MTENIGFVLMKPDPVALPPWLPVCLLVEGGWRSPSEPPFWGSSLQIQPATLPPRPLPLRPPFSCMKRCPLPLLLFCSPSAPSVFLPFFNPISPLIFSLLTFCCPSRSLARSRAARSPRSPGTFYSGGFTVPPSSRSAEWGEGRGRK